MTITEEELQQKILLDTEKVNIEEHIYDLLQMEQTEDTKQQIESLKELITDITKQYTLIYGKEKDSYPVKRRYTITNKFPTNKTARVKNV